MILGIAKDFYHTKSYRNVELNMEIAIYCISS